MKPIITPEDITDEMAVYIMQNAIFSLGMSDDVNNTTLCLCAAMKKGVAAILREREQSGHGI